MSPALLLACLWVLAATGVAFLPMRLQYAPGLLLLVLAVPLLIYVGAQHGWLLVLAVLFAVVSMFRRPLYFLFRHLIRKARGEAADDSQEEAK